MWMENSFIVRQPFSVKGILRMGYSTRIFYCAVLLVSLVSLGVGQSDKARIQDISFTSVYDGSEQKYVIMLPDSFSKHGMYDIIIGLHGHGADRWQFMKDGRTECTAFRTFATERGMVAVSPDYRAKTSWMGPAAERDLLQIIHELRRKFIVKRVYLVGGSMGGTSALTFSALHPQLVDGVVSMNGHANHLEFNNFQHAIAESFGGAKDVLPDEYKRRSAEYWPEKMVMPIAMTVGLADSIVPPASTIRLANILKGLNHMVSLRVDSVGGHETNFNDAYSAIKFIVDGIDTID